MKELPVRKQMRLKDYDYRKNGAYFITICVKDKHEMLWKNIPVGAIINRPLLSEYGLIIERTIGEISAKYPMIVVDKYVIMPNHVHILLIVDAGDSGRLIIAPTISTVIQQMKRVVSKEIGFSLWQKSFHDHIIRNEDEYQKIWQYIDTNPVNWIEDCYHPTPDK